MPENTALPRLAMIKCTTTHFQCYSQLPFQMALAQPTHTHTHTTSSTLTSGKSLFERRACFHAEKSKLLHSQLDQTKPTCLALDGVVFKLRRDSIIMLEAL